MLDIKFVRSNPDDVKDALRKRRSKLDLEEFLRLDQKRRELGEAVNSRLRRNQASGEISRMKKTGGERRGPVGRNGRRSRPASRPWTRICGPSTSKLHWVLSIPNIPHASVPEGMDEADNPDCPDLGRKAGPEFFAFKEHHELGTALGGLDFETAGKLTGSRFVLLRLGARKWNEP